MTLTVGSLFSGIGGLDLGLERAGMTVRWQSEIDPYACRVLAKHWPDVPNIGDVRAVDWSTVERVDLICGGYPCQPFSLAGVRAGDTDTRHLWPYFRDALDVLRPRYALLENVPGHLSLGFGRVLGDLAELGFDAEWACIPAAAVGAPHLRYRVFVVAHAQRDELRDESVTVAGRSSTTVTRDDGAQGVVADADGERLEERRLPEGQERPHLSDAARGDRSGEAMADTDSVVRAATESLGRRRGKVGESGTLAGTVGRLGLLGDAWSVEPDVGRVAHGVPSRVDRLRCLGNAVVPQVAEWVGRQIVEAA